MELLICCLAGAIGAYLFCKLKIPVGALIGAIVFSSFFHILTGLGETSSALKTAVQAIAGAFIGQGITKAKLKELRLITGAALLMFVCAVIYTLVIGKLLTAISSLDSVSAMVCAMPGGLSDIAIISSDLGADSTKCVIVQTVRSVFSILFLPQIAFRVCGKNRSGTALAELNPQNTEANGSAEKTDLRTNKNFAITLALALSLGFCGKALGIPAGALTFGMLSVAVFNVFSGRAYLPKYMKTAAQCLTGVIVGMRISRDDLGSVAQLVIPVIVILLCSLIFNYVCGFLIHKLCKLDLSTSLFSSIPAGASDMALIATDLGGDPAKVSILHLVRYISILSIMPIIIKLFL